MPRPVVFLFLAQLSDRAGIVEAGNRAVSKQVLRTEVDLLCDRIKHERSGFDPSVPHVHRAIDTPCSMHQHESLLARPCAVGVVAPRQLVAPALRLAPPEPPKPNAGWDAGIWDGLDGRSVPTLAE